MVKTIDNMSLVAKAQSGCEYALNQLAADVYRNICPVLYRMTRDYTLAQDLTQETLLVMLGSIKNLDEVEGFWGWIHTIARNKVYDHFRKNNRRKTLELSTFDYINACKKNESNNPLKHAIDKETMECLDAAIGKLRKHYRDVVNLRCFEKKSYSEISMMNGCTPQQARVRFFRAKQSMKKRLFAADLEMDRQTG